MNRLHMSLPSNEAQWDGEYLFELIKLTSSMSDEDKKSFTTTYPHYIPAQISKLRKDVRACDRRGYCLLGENCDIQKSAWQILIPEAPKIERPIVFEGIILMPIIKNGHRIGYISHASDNYNSSFIIEKDGVTSQWNDFVQWSLQRTDNGQVIEVRNKISLDQAVQLHMDAAHKMGLLTHD